MEKPWTFHGMRFHTHKAEDFPFGNLKGDVVRATLLGITADGELFEWARIFPKWQVDDMGEERVTQILKDEAHPPTSASA